MANCHRKGEREVVWKAKVAGEAVLCEDCYRIYLRKFGHLMTLKERPKPSRKFSEEGEPDTEFGTQLGF